MSRIGHWCPEGRAMGPDELQGGRQRWECRKGGGTHFSTPYVGRHSSLFHKHEASVAGNWLRTKKAREEVDLVRRGQTEPAGPSERLVFILRATKKPLKGSKEARRTIRFVSRTHHCSGLNEMEGGWNGRKPGGCRDQKGGGAGAQMRGDGGLDHWVVVVGITPRTSLSSSCSLHWTAWWWAQPWTPVACKI